MSQTPTGGHSPNGDTTHPDVRDEGPNSSGSLACGRSIDALLEQVAEGRAEQRDTHQQSCPHCQAALAEYDRLWSPLRELAAETVTAPDGFIDDALDKIRGAIEDPDYGTVASDTGRGVTRISARVVVVAARQSAQEVPGVRVALGKHLDPTQRQSSDAGSHEAVGAGVNAGVAGNSTAIEITLAADYGTDLRALGDRVRDTVITRVRALTDLDPVEVTIIIDDVLP